MALNRRALNRIVPGGRLLEDPDIRTDSLHHKRQRATSLASHRGRHSGQDAKSAVSYCCCPERLCHLLSVAEVCCF